MFEFERFAGKQELMEFFAVSRKRIAVSLLYLPFEAVSRLEDLAGARWRYDELTEIQKASYKWTSYGGLVQGFRVPDVRH